jgi:hypothetical protein
MANLEKVDMAVLGEVESVIKNNLKISAVQKGSSWGALKCGERY